MSALRLKVILLGAGVLSAIGAGTWLWHDLLEKRWTARKQISQAASENRMLAATMLLQKNGHQVKVAGSLAELDFSNLPDGTLLVGDAAGVVAPYRGAQLLMWVRRGNVLIAQPRWINPVEKAVLAEYDEEEAGNSDDMEESEEKEKEEEEEAVSKKDDAVADIVETDPVAADLGVRIFPSMAKPCKKKDEDEDEDEDAQATPVSKPGVCGPDHPRRIVQLHVPGKAHALQLRASGASLVTLPRAEEPDWSDEDGVSVRAYLQGKGQIIMLSTDFFENDALRHRDHGELLLTLAALRPGSKAITLVKTLDALPWYSALWNNFKLALISLAIGLALLLWMGVRRFGPVLPQPEEERRSLLEHINASAAWLWKAKGGPDLLIEAAREDTRALIQRRAPGLARMAPQELAAALALDTGLPAKDIDAALHDDSARQAQSFTRHIRTLQSLRNHYER